VGIADATAGVVVVAAATGVVVVGPMIGGAPGTIGSVVNVGVEGETDAVVLVGGAAVVASSGDLAARLASSDEAQPAEASAARATRKKARLSTGKSR